MTMPLQTAPGSAFLCFLCFGLFVGLIVWTVVRQRRKVDEELQRITFQVPASPAEFLGALVTESKNSAVVENDVFPGTFTRFVSETEAGTLVNSLGPSDEIKMTRLESVGSDYASGFKATVRAGNRAREFWSITVAVDADGQGTRTVSTPNGARKTSGVDRWAGNLLSSHFKITQVIRDMSGSVEYSGDR